ncbi:vomeronasal type-2 receptor 1-like isoform X3 [Dendropsophus ebraccatus]|uniref:vomeronasal type-2 receptor 1-like isoform X3 n=1 Tax=Dendropsophus ebraccatus TaxID=150705 RepID=UPI003831CFFB
MMTGLTDLLRKYINPLLMLSALRLTNDTTKQPACSLKERSPPKPFVMEGDVVIGGVMKVSESEFLPMLSPLFNLPPLEPVCPSSVLQYFRHLLAFMFAVEEINGQQEILPNITLGYILHDSCETERAALHQALCIISGRETMAPNYDCFQKGRLVGIVGHRYSSVSASIASVTGIYRYPQISYGSRDSVFNDDVNLLSFHRTFPGQRAQHDALIQLLKHFGWTWVGIFSSVGDSSQRSSLELKERLTQSGICVEFLITVNNAFIQLNYYLKRIHLFTPGGEEIYFTKDGHFRTKFDILNYILFDNGSSQRNTVGYYRETTDGFQLEVNDSAIWWNPHFSQTPQSTCSKRCLLGYHRIPIKGHQKCCYTCVPCPKGQIANTTE